MRIFQQPIIPTLESPNKLSERFMLRWKLFWFLPELIRSWKSCGSARAPSAGGKGLWVAGAEVVVLSSGVTRGHRFLSQLQTDWGPHPRHRATWTDPNWEQMRKKLCFCALPFITRKTVLPKDHEYAHMCHPEFRNIASVRIVSWPPTIRLAFQRSDPSKISICTVADIQPRIWWGCYSN